MKIAGIYALYWEITSMVYIGQSQDVNRRFREHISKLKAGKHTNYKVTEHYSNFGIPELVILEICGIDKLNELEIVWTSEFNSLEDGLNVTEAGKVGYGANGNASKYTKLQILKVFRALYGDPYYNYFTIANKVGVTYNLVHDIMWGKSHLWLQDKYPDLYSRMISNKEVHYNNSKSYRTVYGKVATVLDTKTGILYEVSNIREFSKIHGLNNAHLGGVIRRQRKSHKGFIVVQSTEI